MYLPRTGPYMVWVPTNLPVSENKKKKKKTDKREGGKEERERRRQGGRKENTIYWPFVSLLY